MKIWKVSVTGAVLLTVTVCAILVKNEWEQKIERLQLLNKVTNEELQITRKIVKEGSEAAGKGQRNCASGITTKMNSSTRRVYDNVLWHGYHIGNGQWC